MFRERAMGYKHYYCKEFGTLRPILPDGTFYSPFDPKQGENFEPALDDPTGIRPLRLRIIGRKIRMFFKQLTEFSRQNILPGSQLRGLPIRQRRDLAHQ